MSMSMSKDQATTAVYAAPQERIDRMYSECVPPTQSTRMFYEAVWRAQIVHVLAAVGLYFIIRTTLQVLEQYAR